MTDLPPGWDRRTSKRRGGRSYYVHRPTQRSQWTRPHATTIAALPDELLLLTFDAVAMRGSAADSIALAGVSSRWRQICQQHFIVELDLSALTGAPAVWLPGELLLAISEPTPTPTPSLPT